MTADPGAGRGPVPPAGGHGDDARRIARWLGRPVGQLLDLSASLNPVAPDVAATVRDVVGDLGHYPDPDGATRALAETIGVDPGVLVLTNGAAEAIALVARLEPVGAVEDPEFALYRRHLDVVDPGAPAWRSNPRNPLGTLAAPSETAHVWDEAFFPLSTGRWTRGDDAAWRIGSLTKLWACPGLRIGYVIAPDRAAADAVRACQPRWAVGGLGLAVVQALLPVTDLPATAATIGVLRGDLVDALRRRGVGVTDTEACWVLAHHDGLRELLAPHGVLVRDCASFGMPGVCRIAVPDDVGRARLLDALDIALGWP